VTNSRSHQKDRDDRRDVGGVGSCSCGARVILAARVGIRATKHLVVKLDNGSYAGGTNVSAPFRSKSMAQPTADALLARHLTVNSILMKSKGMHAKTSSDQQELHRSPTPSAPTARTPFHSAPGFMRSNFGIVVTPPDPLFF